jgi:hypothetical protein
MRRFPGALALLVSLAAASGCAHAPAPAAPAWWTTFADADTVRVVPLADGVRHVYLWLPRGPWAVHVIEIDERVCAPRIAARKAGPPLDALAPTSALGARAMVAINADFFQAPGGTPVGAHVEGGRVLAGPGARPLYARTVAGRPWAGWARLAGHAVAGRDSIEITQVNRPLEGGQHQPPRPGLTLFDEWFGHVAPAGGLAVRVRRDADAVGGVVASIHAGGEAAPLDDAHIVLHGVGAAAAAWLARRRVGEHVGWHVRLVPAAGPAGEAPVGTAAAAAARETGAAGGGAPMAAAVAGGSAAAAEAVGGFPMLLAGGRGVYAEQTGVIAGFGPVRHPRTAVGWDERGGRTLWVVVDGRSPPYSDGMSLPELEWLFVRIGATDAINLDGGGSTTLVIADRLINRPSDADGERAVANVLALDGCA